MDSMGQVDSATIYMLDCVDTIDTVLTYRHFYTASIGYRSKSGKGRNIYSGVKGINFLVENLRAEVYAPYA